MASYKMDHRALTRSTDLKKILYIVVHNKIQNLDNDLILLVTSQKRKEKKNLILLVYFYAFYPSWSCHYSFSKKSLPNPYKERKKRKIKSSILNSFNSLFYQKKKKNSDFAVGALNLDATHQMVCINYDMYPQPPIFTAEFQTTSHQTKLC